MPSTGTMTFMPRNAAPLAVKSTAPFADVPTAITVVMPLSLRIFSRSVLQELVRTGQHVRLVRLRRHVLDDVGRRACWR